MHMLIENPLLSCLIDERNMLFWLFSFSFCYIIVMSKQKRILSQGWGHLITWNRPMMGHLNSFSASGGGNLSKNVSKIQMPGGLPGGDVEALIWLVHNAYQWYFLVMYVYMPGWYALSWSGYCTLPNWLRKHRKYPRIKLITHWVRKTFTLQKLTGWFI